MSRTVRRVWVTRAEPGAARTAARLNALGFEAVVAPVLAIEPRDPGPIPDHAALVFTSPNGVAAFARLTDRRDRPVLAVGAATAEAARAQGWPDVRSADGDVHALARLIRAAPLRGLLLSPGAERRAGDLPGLAADAAEVRPFPVYAAIQTGAQPPADFDAVLVHSPRAGQALAALGAPRFSGRLAVAISEAAAAALAPLSLTRILIAPAPNEDALLSALGKPGSRV